VAGSIQAAIFPVIKEEFTLTNQQLGVIVAIPALCQALFTIPAGLLSDRIGAKKLTALSIGMAAAGALIAGLSRNIIMFTVATALLTLNSTFYHPSASSYVTRNASPKDRSKVLGLLDSGGIFGFALGPLSITILMETMGYSWRQTYLFWVIPIILGLGVLYFVEPESDGPPSSATEKPALETEKEPKLLSTGMTIFLLSTGIIGLGSSMTATFLSIYLAESRGWSLASIGFMLGVSRLTGLIAPPLGGGFASRFGEKRCVVTSQFASYACFLAAFLTKDMLPFMMLYLAYNFLSTLGMPATQAITAHLSPRRKMATGYALYFLPISIVGIIGPILAAFIADYVGMFPIFMVSAALFYLGLGMLELGVRID
jgi:MFS family permease